ncbi:hypothetical protein JD969_20375 [Planctomycetota bacterium]|nr:hypothetical protein JD969_20375 [Planctomycetota bacterium]
MQGVKGISCTKCGRSGGNLYVDGGINWGQEGDYEITSLNFEVDLKEHKEFMFFEANLCPNCFRKIILPALKKAGIPTAIKIFRFDAN